MTRVFQFKQAAGIGQRPAVECGHAEPSSNMPFLACLTAIYFYNIGNMEIQTAVNALSALAQETRLEIFRYLVRSGPEGAPVREIRDALAIPDATLSFHLSTLKHAGMLQCRREGRQLFYRADYDSMRRLMLFLSEDCCGGNPEMCAGLSTAADSCR